MRVAIAQVDVTPFDVEGNVAKHHEYIGRARAEGADLLVFPELSLTGYKVGSRAYELGMPVWHRVLEDLAEAAGEMGVVVGFVEEGYAAQFFCAAAYLKGGEVRFVHRKLNLANYGAMEEAKHFAPGRYVETVPVVPPFAGAILLCADTWNPALVHLAALHGATMLIVPTNSSNDEASGDFSKPKTWDVVLRFYSMIYGLPVVFVNRVGREDGHQFWGGSRVLDPHGEELVRARGDEEGLFLAELSYDAVRKARYALPTVRDSNLDVVHREIDRLVRRLGVPERIRDDH